MGSYNFQWHHHVYYFLSPLWITERLRSQYSSWIQIYSGLPEKCCNLYHWYVQHMVLTHVHSKTWGKPRKSNYTFFPVNYLPKKAFWKIPNWNDFSLARSWNWEQKSLVFGERPDPGPVNVCLGPSRPFPSTLMGLWSQRRNGKGAVLETAVTWAPDVPTGGLQEGFTIRAINMDVTFILK